MERSQLKTLIRESSELHDRIGSPREGGKIEEKRNLGIELMSHKRPEL